jgi:hypothetical protein
MTSMLPVTLDELIVGVVGVIAAVSVLTLLAWWLIGAPGRRDLSGVGSPLDDAVAADLDTHGPADRTGS